jgi:hypothetical protein
MVLRVVFLKPSKYAIDGFVDRYRRGIMPNSTLPHLGSMTPRDLRGIPLECHLVDEGVQTDLEYLKLLEPRAGLRTLLALVGVQSHQFHRALDLGAYARDRGCLAVMGGPHPMTCDTSLFHGRGVSFALAEAELVWPAILEDALDGDLRPVYGRDERWQMELDSPVIVPPPRRDLGRYILPMLGLYPARGCPFACNFCSVIKIAGRRVRGQSHETTLRSLRAARAQGVRMIFFTSDNFNKIPGVRELLESMIADRLDLKFFVQCDAQISEEEELVALLARAGCFQMFVGVESFNRRTLLSARKAHNRPERYGRIAALCRREKITSHFSNILGFPDDTEEGIADHLGTLRELDPHVASFYILCPIPGTEQYDEFRRSGWITESNLDRFDATGLTWKHPRLSAGVLDRWLFRCYEEFYSSRHGLRSMGGIPWGGKDMPIWGLSTVGNWAFSRYSAWRRIHPMSGGVGRVRLDGEQEFLPLRRRTFGCERAPLPESLTLPERSAELNAVVNPRWTTGAR